MPPFMPHIFDAISIEGRHFPQERLATGKRKHAQLKPAEFRFPERQCPMLSIFLRQKDVLSFIAYKKGNVSYVALIGCRMTRLRKWHVDMSSLKIAWVCLGVDFRHLVSCPLWCLYCCHQWALSDYDKSRSLSKVTWSVTWKPRELTLPIPTRIYQVQLMARFALLPPPVGHIGVDTCRVRSYVNWLHCQAKTDAK